MFSALYGSRSQSWHAQSGIRFILSVDFFKMFVFIYFTLLSSSPPALMYFVTWLLPYHPGSWVPAPSHFLSDEVKIKYDIAQFHVSANGQENHKHTTWSRHPLQDNSLALAAPQHQTMNINNGRWFTKCKSWHKQPRRTSHAVTNIRFVYDNLLTAYYVRN